MTDKEKLIQLIKTGEQCNIDLGVYQWLAQGFDKTELCSFLATQLMTGKEFYDYGFDLDNCRLRYKWDISGSFIILSCGNVLLGKKRIFTQMNFHSFYQDFFATILDLIESKLAN